MSAGIGWTWGSEQRAAGKGAGGARGEQGARESRRAGRASLAFWPR